MHLFNLYFYVFLYIQKMKEVVNATFWIHFLSLANQFSVIWLWKYHLIFHQRGFISEYSIPYLEKIQLGKTN